MQEPFQLNVDKDGARESETGAKMDRGSTGGLSKEGGRGLRNQKQEVHSPTAGAGTQAVSTRSSSKRAARMTRSTASVVDIVDSSTKPESRGKRPSTRAQSKKADSDGAEVASQGVDVKKPRKGDAVDTAPLSETPKVF